MFMIIMICRKKAKTVLNYEQHYTVKEHRLNLELTFSVPKLGFVLDSPMQILGYKEQWQGKRSLKLKLPPKLLLKKNVEVIGQNSLHELAYQKLFLKPDQFDSSVLCPNLERTKTQPF